MGAKVKEWPAKPPGKRPRVPAIPVTETMVACGLAFGLAALPLTAGKLATPSGLASSAGLLLLFAAVTAVALSRRQLLFRPNWLDSAILIWVGILLLSCFWSVNLHRSLLALSQALSYSGVFFLTRWLAGREKWGRLLLGAVGTGAFLSAAVGLQAYVTNVVLLDNPQWRTFGPFINPNAFAGYLLVASPALAFLALSERSDILRGCSWVSLAVAVGVLFLTGSKGAILAWLVVLGVLAVRLTVRLQASSHRTALRVALLGGVVAVAAAGFALPPLQERLTAIGAESHSALFRAYTWLGSLRMASARPVLGWGAGAFESVFAKFAIAGYTREAHNDYLQMAADAGFLGLGAYLVVIVGAVARSWKTSAAGRSQALLALACLAAALSFCLHTLVDFDLPVLATGATLFLVFGLGSTAPVRSTQNEGRPLRPGARFGLAALLGAALFLSGYSITSAYAESQRLAGEKELSAGNVSSAILHLQRATRLVPINAEAHRNLTRALEADYLRSGERDVLVSAKKQAIYATSYDRMRAVNWLLLARLEARLGRENAVEPWLWRATRMAPNDPHTWLVLAEFLLSKALRASTPRDAELAHKKAQSALEQIEKIEEGPAGKVKAVPDLVDLTFSRARLYSGRERLNEGKFGEALASADRVLGEIMRYRSSKSVQALLSIGEEPYPAVERLEAMALLLRAEARRRLGDKEAAERDEEAASKAWSEATEAFPLFLEGGILP